MTATRDYLRRADYERAWHDGERLTISDVVGFSIETRTTTTPRLDSDWSRRDQDQKERLAVGITRVSIGAQSFEPAVLTALGRCHRPADIERGVLALERDTSRVRFVTHRLIGDDEVAQAAERIALAVKTAR